MKFIDTRSWSQDEAATQRTESNAIKKDKNSDQPKTELWKKLMEIREAAIAEGMQLKSLEELERDNEERKGTIT